MADHKKSGEPATWVAVLFFAFLAAVLLAENISPLAARQSIPYSQFKQLVQIGQVVDLMISPSEIRGRLTHNAGTAPLSE